MRFTSVIAIFRIIKQQNRDTQQLFGSPQWRFHTNEKFPFPCAELSRRKKPSKIPISRTFKPAKLQQLTDATVVNENTDSKKIINKHFLGN